MREYGRVKYTKGDYVFTYIKHNDFITLYWNDGDIKGYEGDSMMYPMKQFRHLLDIELYKFIS